MTGTAAAAPGEAGPDGDTLIPRDSKLTRSGQGQQGCAADEHSAGAQVSGHRFSTLVTTPPQTRHPFGMDQRVRWK